MMHRTQIYLNKRDIEKLKEIRRETGKSMGEIIRRLVEEYLEKLDKRRR